jgi:hypothetical protein
VAGARSGSSLKAVAESVTGNEPTTRWSNAV